MEFISCVPLLLGRLWPQIKLTTELESARQNGMQTDSLSHEKAVVLFHQIFVSHYQELEEEEELTLADWCG